MNYLKMIFGGSQTAMSAAEAKTFIDENKDVVVIDVRQASEYRSGHIPGAKLIPLSDLPQQMSSLPNNKTILCVCRSGSRSGIAVRNLTSAGYKAINLQGGMMRWERARFPVKTGS